MRKRRQHNGWICNPGAGVQVTSSRTYHGPLRFGIIPLILLSMLLVLNSLKAFYILTIRPG